MRFTAHNWLNSANSQDIYYALPMSPKQASLYEVILTRWNGYGVSLWSPYLTWEYTRWLLLSRHRMCNAVCYVCTTTKAFSLVTPFFSSLVRSGKHCFGVAIFRWWRLTCEMDQLSIKDSSDCKSRWHGSCYACKQRVGNRWFRPVDMNTGFGSWYDWWHTSFWGHVEAIPNALGRNHCFDGHGRMTAPLQSSRWWIVQRSNRKQSSNFCSNHIPVLVITYGRVRHISRAESWSDWHSQKHSSLNRTITRM